MKQVWDLRTGGQRNWLLVEHPNGTREAWLVDYDRWRDAHWNVSDAWQKIEGGELAATPVIHRLFEWDLGTINRHWKLNA